MITRRTLLKQTTAVSAVLTLGATHVNARQAVPLEESSHPFDRFMAASTHITGYSDLSPDTGYRIYLALQESSWLDGVTKAPRADQLSSETRRKLLDVWYLGVVETPDGPVPAAYEDALMFKPLEGIVPTRSYCPGEKFFWAKPPTEPVGYKAYAGKDAPHDG